MGSRLAGKAAFVAGGSGEPQDEHGTETGTGQVGMVGTDLTGASHGMKAGAPQHSTRAKLMYTQQILTPKPGELTPEQDAARQEAIPPCIVGDQMDIARGSLYPAIFGARHVGGAEL